jgi:hypothetical protein
MGIGEGELRLGKRLGKKPGEIVIHVLEYHVHGTCIEERSSSMSLNGKSEG